jgi:hypothetical protein
MIENKTQLSAQKTILLMELEESQGEITPDIEALLADIEMDVKEKLEWMCSRYEQDMALASAKKEKKLLINKRQQSAEKSAEWWKSNIDELMKFGDLEKVDIGEYDISYRDSESVEVDDGFVMDSRNEYVTEKITCTPNKTYIKEMIKSGEIVPNASIIKHKRIQIK